MVKIGLVIEQNENINSAIMFIKKNWGKSISEIKKEIANSNIVVEANYFSETEMQNLKSTVEMFIKSEIKFYLLELDGSQKKIFLVEDFFNSLDTSKSIAEERGRIDSILYDDEN